MTGAVWQAGAGVLALVALVIAFGLSSTHRPVLERPRVMGRRAADGSPLQASGARVERQLTDTLPMAAVRDVPAPRAAVAPASELVGSPPVDSVPTPVTGWWLVLADTSRENVTQPGSGEEEPTGPLTRPVTGPQTDSRTVLARARVVAGPFPDRVDAELAALTNGTGLAGGPAQPEVSVAYGVRRPEGTLTSRPAPAELAWLAELGSVLDRLPADWDTVVSDTDPRTTLVVELAAALTEAGLPIHDCDGRASGDTHGRTADGTADGTFDGIATPDRVWAGGGVCLTPHPAGVLVSWAASDRLSLHTGRDVLEAAVRDTMATALTDVLALCGFEVQPRPASSAVLVRVR